MKLLLDTSFLLPILGISIGKYDETLLKIEKYELYISRFSILEALWVTIRLIKRNINIPINEIEIRLKSILESGKFYIITEDSKIFNDALKLYISGHRDLIDCILYSSALNLNIYFLTIDKELKDFIRRLGIKDITITPEELK